MIGVSETVSDEEEEEEETDMHRFALTIEENH